MQNDDRITTEVEAGPNGKFRAVVTDRRRVRPGYSAAAPSFFPERETREQAQRDVEADLARMRAEQIS